MVKQLKNIIQTKQNLTDAFWCIYTKKRIEKITVKEITEKAGYNRSTFYEYFNDVYDLLEQLENSLLPELEDLPPIKLNSTKSVLSIDSILNIYEKNSSYYTVLLGDNGDPAFSSKLKNNVKQKLLAHLVSQYQIDELKLDFALEFILSAMIGILTYWFENKNKMSQEMLITLIYELMEGLPKTLIQKQTPITLK